MNAFILIFIIVTQTLIFAQEDFSSTLCQKQSSPEEKTSKRKHVPLRLILNLSFNPKSLVDIRELTSTAQEGKASKKFLFNLIAPEEMSYEEKSKLRQLRKKIQHNLKALRKLDFFESLRSQTSYEACKSFVSEKTISSLLIEIDNDYRKFIPLAEKDLRVKTRRLIERQLPSFKRKGWKIYSDLTVNEIHSIIKDNPLATVMMVGHSAPNGELINGKKKALPASFFRNTQIANLLIYSCYTQEVIKFYQLDNTPSVQNYFYPKAKPIAAAEIGENKIPMNSLKSVHKVHFGEVDGVTSPKICSLKGPMENQYMSVFLNKVYLGALSREVSFDCNLLKASNLIEVYQTSDTGVSSINLTNLWLNNNIPIAIKEYISRTTNKHIVSKGTVSLQGENL
jgi:hypothetical protein